MPRPRATEAPEPPAFDPRVHRPLPRAFYDRPALAVARDLLGRVLVRRERGVTLAARLVEVEAYRGADDPASHAYRGPTARNAVMFGPPGRAYVYFTYGMHHCVNVVCRERGRAEAVLLRGAAPLLGLARMRSRRGGAADAALLRGPGCLARSFGLTREHDGEDLTRGGVWIADAPPVREGRRVRRGPRIGIRVAVERPWRLWLEGHPCVSGPRRLAAAPERAKPR